MGSPLVVNGHDSPNTHFPFPADAGHTITHRGLKITTRKLPILKAEPIEQMTSKLGIAPPEMIFGDNFTSIEYASYGWSLEFNTFDALDQVDKTGASMLQVAHSKQWQTTRWADPLARRSCLKRADLSQAREASGYHGSGEAI